MSEGKLSRGRGDVRVKRIYEAPAQDDGLRVLVDRLWPRGVAKTDAHVDSWLKEVAPSPELRKWFAHDPARFDVFRRSYREQLSTDPLHQQAVVSLLQYVRENPTTLLFAAKDLTFNHAMVLRNFILEKLNVDDSHP